MRNWHESWCDSINRTRILTVLRLFLFHMWNTTVSFPMKNGILSSQLFSILVRNVTVNFLSLDKKFRQSGLNRRQKNGQK